MFENSGQGHHISARVDQSARLPNAGVRETVETRPTTGLDLHHSRLDGIALELAEVQGRLGAVLHRLVGPRPEPGNVDKVRPTPLAPESALGRLDAVARALEVRADELRSMVGVLEEVA